MKLCLDPATEGVGSTAVNTAPPTVTNPPVQVTSPAAPVKTVLKVDGLEREVTQEELVAIAQKNLAADQRLAEATRLRDEHKIAVGLGADILKAKDGDMDALRRVGMALNYSQEELDAMLSQQPTRAPAGGRAAPAAPPAQPDWSKVPGYDVLQNLGVSPQEFFAEAAASLIQEKRTGIEQDISRALDADDVLSQYNHSKETRDKLTRVMGDAIHRIFRDSGGRTNYKDHGPDMIRAALREARELVGTFAGIRSRGEEIAASLGLPNAGTAVAGGPNRTPEKLSLFGTPKNPDDPDPFFQNLAARAFDMASQRGGR